MLDSILKSSFEDIAFQHGKSVYEDILRELNSFRLSVDIDFGVVDEFGQFLKIYIKERFNLTIMPRVLSRGSPGGFEISFNPLAISDPHITKSDLNKNIYSAKNIDVSELDHIGRTIVFDKGLVRLTKGTDLIKPVLTMPEDAFYDKDVTNAMIAGALCHEIAHVFVYLICLKYTVSYSRTIASVYDRFSKESTTEDRLLFVKHTATQEQLHFDSPEILAEAKTPEEALMVVSVAYAEKFRKDNELVSFTESPIEQLTDRMAVRMGAAKGLADYIALGRRAEKRTFRYLLVGKIAARVALGITLSMVSTIGLTAGVFFSFFISSTLNRHFNIFIALAMVGPFVNAIFGFRSTANEVNLERTKVFRNELIAGIKDRSIPDDHAKALLSDIVYVEQILNSDDYKKALLEHISTTISYLSGNYRQVTFQKQYEELLNNKLFARAAHIEHSK